MHFLPTIVRFGTLAWILICCGCAQLTTGATVQPDPPAASEEKVAALRPTLNNMAGMEFVQIPSGSFLMGSSDAEQGRDRDETLHKVTLTESFYLQTTEVTQQQWSETMGNNPSFFNNCGPDCPVESVSWLDSQQFISRLNKADADYNYRLPTESEWEYAARAGSTTALPTGKFAGSDLFSDQTLDPLGWYVGNSQQGTHQVGQKTANAWGLHDMHGNVKEWSNDWHHIYPFTAVTNPQGPKTGWSKIRRGGSWNLYTRHLRSASRDWANLNNRDPFTGLRLVMRKKPAAPPIKTMAPKEMAVRRPRQWEVLFDYDRSEILPAMQPILTDVLDTSEKGDQLILTGHTCDLGSEPYNLMLSKQRVETIRDDLVRKGISSRQLRIEFYGEDNPGHPNENEEGRSNNRRVTITLKPAQSSNQ